MAKVCPNCELAYSDDDFFCAADGSPLRSTTAESDNLVGTVIADRYRVEAIIGEGGMGRVYRARHVRVPREAAIKVLRRALIADPYAVAAFNREARNAALVGDHPNVAAVYDFGETPDGLVFLAMEFVEGETLSRLLEREPVLPPPRAVEIVRQVAAALTAAHELPEPVVHRDLKPDNILLKATRDGTTWAKVVDFGIAKAIKRDTQLLTTPGLVVGTPRYMSPEQLTGGDVGVRSDVYALGLIAFQMLTGRMPFASSGSADESTIQWALQRLSVRPLSLAQVRPDVQWPAAAQDVFERALAPAAVERMTSANELARMLGHVFGLSTPSSPVGAIGAQRTMPPSLAPAAAPAAELAVSAAPLAVENVGSMASTPEAGTAVPGRPPRRNAGMIGGAAVAALILVAAAGLLWRRSSTEPATAVASLGVPNAPPGTRGSAPRSDTSETTALPPQPEQRLAGDSASDPRTPELASGPVSATKRDVPATGGSSSPIRTRDAGSAAMSTRAALDAVKASLADPDAVASAGTGEPLLRRIQRLLPTLASGADSVEATYYAVETNLILDRPAEACRLLGRVRDASRGTAFEAQVERLLEDKDLACGSRR